jgi:hypothetical protein
MTAAERLVALETLDAETLCSRAETALAALVEVMNRETTFLRAGHIREATGLTGEKTQLAQDYVTLARAVQRAAPRLKAEAPARTDALRRGHEALATAKTVTEHLLSDVARSAGNTAKPKTYSASGQPPQQSTDAMKGISINRAL